MNPMQHGPAEFTRADLEKTWNDAANANGARGVRIVNDVDLEEAPNVPADFEWSERDYT